MYIGNRIRRIRTKKGLSQNKASHGIVSPSHYSNIEKGRFKPSPDVLLLLADKFDIPSAYFLDFNEGNKDFEDLLKKYEKHLRISEKEEVNQFIKSNEPKFTFIPSLNHELKFNLLEYIRLFKFLKISEAQEHYLRNIASLEIQSNDLTIAVLEKYYYVSGLYNYYKKEYMNSISFYKKAIELNQDNVFRAKLIYNISLALFNLYKYVEALEYAHKAKSIYMNLHDWNKVGDCYNLIAALLIEKNNFTEAKKYIHKGFSVLREPSLTIHAKLHHNYSIIYLEQESYTKALENINTSIRLKKQLKSRDVFLSQRKKLEILLKIKDIESYKKYMESVKRFAQSDTDKAYYQHLKAKMHYLQKDYEPYEEIIKSTISYFLKVGNPKYLKENAEHYSIYLAENKRYKDAYEYQKISLDSYKSLYGG